MIPLINHASASGDQGSVVMTFTEIIYLYIYISVYLYISLYIYRYIYIYIYIYISISISYLMYPYLYLSKSVYIFYKSRYTQIHGAYGIVKSRSFRVTPSVCLPGLPGHVALPHRGVELRRGLRQAPQGGAEDLAITDQDCICVILRVLYKLSQHRLTSTQIRYIIQTHIYISYIYI